MTEHAGADGDTCERIMESISTFCSSMEVRVADLVRSKAASVDHKRGLLMLGKLLPLQKRLQRMHSKLQEFGRRLPIPPGVSQSDVNALSQQVSAAAPINIPFALNQETSTPCNKVAILTFGRWTKQTTDVLQRAGLVKDRGEFGCHYLVHLQKFQKEYLEEIRRPCLYHVITEEHRVSEVMAIVGLLSCSERGRLKKWEVVDLPTPDSASMREQQTVSGSAACLASSSGQADGVPDHPFQGGLAEVGQVTWRQGGALDDDLSTMGAAGPSTPMYSENENCDERDGVSWTLIGIHSF